MAGLSEPSDSRAGRRSSSSGRFDGDSSITIALRGMRSAMRGEDVRGAQRLARRRAARAAAGGATTRRRRARARRHDAQRARRRPAPGAASTARSALLRCTSARVAADHRDDACPASTNGPAMNGYCRNTGAPTASTRSCGASVSRRRDAVGRQVAGEQRVILREPGARAERLLPDRAREPLGQRDERLPGLGVVGARPDDERRARARRRRAPRARRRRRRRRPRRAHDAARRGALVRLAGLGEPSRPSARSRAPGPLAGDGLVARARAIAPGTSCGAHGLVDPHRVLAREPAQLAREERLGARGGADPAGRRRRRAARG